MSDHFLHVPLAEITASLKNPRTVFNAEKLSELADDIKSRGVDTPILLRPLPGARVADTDRKVKYEIVFGERRFRASQQAGVPTIPARIRELTDEQAYTAQLIENLNREDLTALEEAEGIRHMMDELKSNADDVAVRIKKSRRHVYNRLELLKLCQEGREALKTGKIEASVALLVARIPGGKLQAKFLKEVLAGGRYTYGNGEPMSYRGALELAQNSYMLKLADARFKITVADLVPGVGSCKDCSKRTGANPDLFSDVKSADVCTDPPCFHKKEEAATALLVKEAEAKGQTVIAGKEAEELHLGYGASARFKGYKRLDEKEDSPTGEPLRKLIGKLMESKGIKPTMLEHPTKKGQLVAALPNDVANTLLKEVQQQAKAEKKETPKAVQDLLDEKAHQEKARLDARYEREVRAQIIAHTWDQIQHATTAFKAQGSFTLDVHRHLAEKAAWNLDAEATEAVSKLLDLGPVGARAGITQHLQKAQRPDQLHLLFLMHGRSGEGFDLVTQAVHGEDLKTVTQRIEAEVKARVYPKAPPKATQKTTSTDGPAARRKTHAGGQATNPPARAATLSEQEAKQGIADAMQGLEEPASAPKGAVAPAAAPGGKQEGAWPFSSPDKRDRRTPNQRKAAAADAHFLELPADPLVHKALKAIIKAQKASVRLLKDELGIGTAKAMQIMVILEAAGKVSAAEERGARKVLVAA